MIVQTRYPVLFIPFLIFGLIFSFKVKRAGKNKTEDLEEMLRKEHEAAFVRNKPIDESLFLIPDISRLHIWDEEYIKSRISDFTPEEKRALKLQEVVLYNTKRKMLHFKGESNIDLKLRFGAANLENIIQYESTYQTYLESLFEWGKSLVEAGHHDNAISCLEEAISFGSDLSRNFTLLADLYAMKKNTEQLQILKKRVADLDHLLKNRILRHIDQLLEELEAPAK